MIPQVDLFSFVFGGKATIPKNHFKINWPLIWSFCAQSTFPLLCSSLTQIMSLISRISNMHGVSNNCCQLTELIDLPTFENKYSVLIFTYCKCVWVFFFFCPWKVLEFFLGRNKGLKVVNPLVTHSPPQSNHRDHKSTKVKEHHRSYGSHNSHYTAVVRLWSFHLLTKSTA